MDQIPPPAVAHHGHNVVSGEESEDVFHETATTDEDEHDDLNQQQQRRDRVNRLLGGTDHEVEEEEEDRAYYQWDPSKTSHTDDLYDEHLDDEDEAYVYKNMRGGVRESITVLQSQEQRQSETGSAVGNLDGRRKNQLQMYKPRGTDAVLSCPCCFNIVCMDCQRHSKYPNQFRAIFVMGIIVNWQKILVYDQVHQALVSKQQQQQLERASSEEDETSPNKRHHPVPHDEEKTEATTSLSWLEEPIYSPSTAAIPKTKEGEYFAVECSHCQTQVAALDMLEEVYHFHGCLESSPTL